MSVANKTTVAANIAIVITCAFLVTIVLVTRGPQLLGSAPAPPYQIGDVFSEMKSETQGKNTLVLVFRTNCIPCRESAPFHRTVVKALQATGTARVVAISPDSTEVASQYLKDNGIAVAAVKSLNRLRVRSTPALFWLDANGIIRQLWVGRLPAEREAQVFRTLAIQGSPAAN